MVVSKEQKVESGPLISIVVPVLHGDWVRLRACLASIARQSYRNHEVVVVDSSADFDTETISRKFGAKHIRLRASKPIARNLGVNVSRGELIIHLDADMALSDNVLSECAIQFQEGADAVIIPEVVLGDGFLAECRKLEKESCIDDRALEAARCVSRKVHDLIGGFDQNAGSIDEYAYHAKIERSRCRIDSINEPLFVSEPALDLGKKFRHGRSFRNYKRSYPQKTRQQFSIMHRVSSYLKVSRNKPGHLVTLVLLKGTDLTAFLLGSITSLLVGPKHSSVRGVAELRHTFDSLGHRYETHLLETKGGQAISSEETGAIDKLLGDAIGSNSKEDIPKRLALDLGCGPGRLSGTFLRRGLSTVGIDVSVEMCRVSKQRYKHSEFEAVCADARFLPLRQNVFHYGLCFRMIKYSLYPNVILQEIRRVLVPRGFLILEMPNQLSPFYLLGKIYSRLVRLPVPVIDYMSKTRFFTLRSSRQMMKQCGFSERQFEGLFFLPQGLLAWAFDGNVSGVLSSGNRIFAKDPRTKMFSRSLLFFLESLPSQKEDTDVSTDVNIQSESTPEVLFKVC